MVEQSEPAAGPLMGRRVGEPADPLLAARSSAGPRFVATPATTSRG